MIKKIAFVILAVCGSYSCLFAHDHKGLEVEVLVDGRPVPEYWHTGTHYIEAIKGKEYAVRLTNHLESRVAIALSVDGLNTIDARHTSAYSAKKWVLEPQESVVISGWQISYHNARKFYFTSEEESYGRQLGQTSNLGIISAVLFKEQDFCMGRPAALSKISPRARENPSQAPREELSAPAGSPTSPKVDRPAQHKLEASRDFVDDGEYAATGIGRKYHHDVHWVNMDLDPNPVTSVSFRYEFRPGLVRLGILPAEPRRSALERRQHAAGFLNEGFCPSPR
jgi:hypothetical protein